MSSMTTWTQRQRREAAFYQDYSALQRVESIDFAPVESTERRPWNPYWYVYDLARTRFVSASQRLLDFGCGVGIASVRLARLGYRVDGFDISRENLGAARDLADRYGLADRCRFGTMIAESLEYENDTFDLIVGIDILHHVDIPDAIREARRVLKPGGIAVFKEHVEVPVIDPIRNTPLFRALAPRDVSLEHHITHDERKLNRTDLDLIQSTFSRVETVRFTLLSRLDRLIPRCNDAFRGRLQRIDHGVLRACPSLAGLGGTVVMICTK